MLYKKLHLVFYIIYLGDFMCLTRPLSRKRIRWLANNLRKAFNLQDDIYIPIVLILEALGREGCFNLELAPISEMPCAFGEYIPSEKILRIREDIYLDASDGDGFARSTCAHELGHFIMGHGEEPIKFSRHANSTAIIKPYEDSEWQANAFAGELLVPKHLVDGLKPMEIVEKCDVTRAMAKYQLYVYKREKF